MSGREQPACVGVARRVSAPVASLRHAGPLSIAWAWPEGGVFVRGVGVASERYAPVVFAGEAPATLPGPWFGGWAFDAARPWPGFDAERWVLPGVLGWTDAEGGWLAAFGADVAELEARLDAVVTLTGAAALDTLRPARGAEGAASSPRTSWGRLVEAALDAIDAGHFDKLVVARTVDVVAASAFDERRVLARLETRFPGCRTFLLRGRDGRAFVGASPEVLVEARHRSISVDALAGTAAPDAAAALLTSDKDLREHHFVVEAILAALKAKGLSPEPVPAPGIKRLKNVVHLHTPVTATLPAGLDALDVARALHPTPAVAGVPRADAVAWLAAHEGFDRGWYAGAIGLRGASSLSLCVALRSALLDGRSARVFAGAGIVSGSTEALEWEETERKAQALLEALELGAPVSTLTPAGARSVLEVERA